MEKQELVCAGMMATRLQPKTITADHVPGKAGFMPPPLPCSPVDAPAFDFPSGRRQAAKSAEADRGFEVSIAASMDQISARVGPPSSANSWRLLRIACYIPATAHTTVDLKMTRTIRKEGEAT